MDVHFTMRFNVLGFTVIIKFTTSSSTTGEMFNDTSNGNIEITWKYTSVHIIIQICLSVCPSGILYVRPPNVSNQIWAFFACLKFVLSARPFLLVDCLSVWLKRLYILEMDESVRHLQYPIQCSDELSQAIASRTSPTGMCQTINCMTIFYWHPSTRTIHSFIHSIIHTWIHSFIHSIIQT